MITKMTAASDEFEQRVANDLNKISHINAKKSNAGTKFGDVIVIDKNIDVRSWIEVKMNHTDNFCNVRVFYNNGWKTTYNSPIANFATKTLNKSKRAKKFINDIENFSNKHPPVIPTTKGGLEHENAVQLKVMQNYFNQPNTSKWIHINEDIDMGALVTYHYIKGKNEPVYYLQAADDFYKIGNVNPLNLPNSVPTLKGRGMFKVRISLREIFYEVQVDMRIKNMLSSDYSVLLNSHKKNPFVK